MMSSPSTTEKVGEIGNVMVSVPRGTMRSIATSPFRFGSVERKGLTKEHQWHRCVVAVYCNHPGKAAKAIRSDNFGGDRQVGRFH
jgi:hypothetical protein